MADVDVFRAGEVRSVLLTGATGFLGRAFVRGLLDDHPGLHIWALVRGKDGTPPARRPELRELVRHPRFHVVEGDLTQPAFGSGSAAALGPSHGAEVVPDELDAVFHLAAATDFRKSRRLQIFQANLEGTKNLLTLLGCLRRVGKLFHVSTAYVAGLRPGEVVREELTEAPERFANPYEESKHAAEAVVARSGLDWTILRLSIVVGDSRTGEAESDKMVYGAFKVCWRLRAVLENKYAAEQLAALPPGRFAVLARADVAKNLICVDDAVRLMMAAVRSGPPAGTVLHIVNPSPSCTAEMHEAMCGSLDLRCLRLDAVSPARPTQEELLIRRGMEVYEPYMNVQEPRFDQARLRALVGDAAVDAVKPVGVERLRFLFDTYLKRRLEASLRMTSVPVAERLAHVQRHGRGALAYSSSVRPGIVALPLGVTSGGYVPFAVKGRTAAMVGDPVCAVAALPAAVDTFLFHCAKHRLSPVAVQVTRPVADLVAERGGHPNRMGDEAELNLRLLPPGLPGGEFEWLRKKISRAARAGVTVREATFSEVPHEIVARVSAEWLETKLNRRELDLLLRPLPDHDEVQVRKFFAFQNGELVGFVLFEPMFEGGRAIGYLASHERFKRRPDGVHSLIILEAARAFQAEGREVLSLGLAPLWNVDEEDHPAACPTVRELLARIRDEVAPVYNFEGVSRHKTYYCPTWKPTYFCSRAGKVTTDVLNVFSMIGLLPPEALTAIGDSTLDMVHGA